MWRYSSKMYQLALISFSLCDFTYKLLCLQTIWIPSTVKPGSETTFLASRVTYENISLELIHYTYCLMNYDVQYAFIFIGSIVLTLVVVIPLPHGFCFVMKLFPIRVIELLEPLVLSRKADGIFALLKSIRWEINVWVTLGDYMIKTQNWENKSVLSRKSIRQKQIFLCRRQYCGYK